MRCRQLADIGRRQFLRGGAVAATGAAILPSARAEAQSAQGLARVAYPSNRLANLSDLAEGEPFEVAYPDADAPGVLIKFGAAVEGGAGPDGDVVGFSTICPHKGFPLAYDATDRSFNCPGHYSRFDPEKGGQQICGQATQNLPQYALRIDDDGEIYAEGIDELLYGRLSNVL